MLLLWHVACWGVRANDVNRLGRLRGLNIPKPKPKPKPKPEQVRRTAQRAASVLLRPEALDVEASPERMARHPLP